MGWAQLAAAVLLLSMMPSTAAPEVVLAPLSPPPPATISNVIKPAHTPDPDVIFHDGWYYSARSKIEVSDDNVDPPGRNCWAAAQDQVRITRARRLQDVYLRPDADVAVIDRSSPFGGGQGGASVGAYAVSTQGGGCPSAGFWAPALKHIDGRWFLFITGHRPDMPGESNFLMESSSQDPLDVAAWQYRGPLLHAAPGLDAEPVVLPLRDERTPAVTLRDNGKTIAGALYLVYSHNNAAEGGTQELRLARLLEDDSKFQEFDADLGRNVTYRRRWRAGQEAVIAAPMAEWESVKCNGCQFRVNEGPTALYGPTKTFIMFSASFCATPYYAIGLLEFAGDGDGFPFLWAKHPRPAFSGNVFAADGSMAGLRRGAYGIGHNSVTVSPDLSESWIVYHAKRTRQETPADREARVQRFAWHADGRPDFLGGPAPGGAKLPAPSAAAAYAVVCSGEAFTGRFCVGLPAPGRYDAAQLAARGVDARGIRSVRLHGGAVATLFAEAPAPGEEHESWSVAADAAQLPQGFIGAVTAVEVMAAAAAAPGSPLQSITVA